MISARTRIKVRGYRPRVSPRATDFVQTLINGGSHDLVIVEITAPYGTVVTEHRIRRWPERVMAINLSQKIRVRLYGGEDING